MDQGIIRSFKLEYQKLMITSFISLYETLANVELLLKNTSIPNVVEFINLNGMLLNHQQLKTALKNVGSAPNKKKNLILRYKTM